MTYQSPIFTTGLFGKANSFVCNSWQEAAAVVAAHAEGMDWAQRQALKGGVPERYLAKVTAASSISANRWSYTFSAIGIDASHGPVSLSGDFGSGTGALNIREIRNDGNHIDGSPLEGFEIGPFGSKWSSGGWLTNLEGYCEMVAEHRTDGSVLFWFDAPNPSRCTSAAYVPGGES